MTTDRSLVSLLLCLWVGTLYGASPLSTFELNEKVGSSYATIENDVLIVGTGTVEQRWIWGGQGLVTTGLKRLDQPQEWIKATPNHYSDWEYMTYTQSASPKIISVSAKSSDDKRFTSTHLELNLEVQYEKVSVLFLVWAYPEAEGLRTQLKIKHHGTVLPAGPHTKYDISPTKRGHVIHLGESKVLTGTTQRWPINTSTPSFQAVGYYNHTQHRNHEDTPILKEENVSLGTVTWASILKATGKDQSLLLVKESHKCVNQAGVNTGVFNLESNGVSATGWGILPKDVTNEFQGYWANWTILCSSASEVEQQFSIKAFDRVRYPIDPKRDIYIMANTWGTGETKNWSQSAAREENVRMEIDSQKDLGIDVQQIDDGWQGPITFAKVWKPVPVLDFGLVKKKVSVDGEAYSKTSQKLSMYPQGWGPIRSYAKDQNIRLGLWCNAKVPLSDLKWNFDHGGFKSYKIDFVKASNYQQLNELMTKVRSFVAYTDHQTRMNWDVTEHPPRIGYFFGREVGNIYLENRKTMQPASVVYKPHLVLRDAWHISKYLNLNKFQITTQNGDRCNREVSDAYLHDADYLVAQTLMGSPIFFQETQYLSYKAREQIRPVLKIYREHRHQMYKDFVFPIGNKPDKSQWTGFQTISTDRSSGYLMIYRPLKSTEPTQELWLSFIGQQSLALSTLAKDEGSSVVAMKNGKIEVTMPKSGRYMFLRYRVIP